MIAIVDTNCDPDFVDYVIPGNDDALRAIRLFASKISESVIEGQAVSKEAAQLRSAGEEPKTSRRWRQRCCHSNALARRRVESAADEESVETPNEAAMM